jgi:hypothetical protein
MTTFDEREKGFEAKYRHDQEAKFKIMARRNKLLGLWAAEKMNVHGPAADAYAKEVVASDFQKPGDSDVVEKVLGDLKAKGVMLAEPALRKEMDRLLAEAEKQIAAEKKA